MARLLVVDDEPQVRGMVVDFLSKAGFSVDGCSCAAELDAALAARPADLVLLDISLPDEDGVSIARRLRAAGPAGIIMLTGLGDPVERIVGIEVGADDYITKPFDLREVRARVKAVLRRLGGDAPAATDADPPPRPSQQAAFGLVALDFDRRCLVDGAGADVPLTAMEFDLLEVFARNPNRVLTRDRLSGAAHNRPHERFDRAIDIRIARLRKKIEADPAKPQVIKTVPGVGYIYVPPRAA